MRIYSIMLNLIGAIVLIIGIVIYLNSKIPSDYVYGYGQVVSNVKNQATSASLRGNVTVIIYFPEIRFNFFGQSYTVQGNVGELFRPQYKAGQYVKIAYNPLNPNVSIKMVNRSPLIIEELLIAFFGCAFIVVGFLLHRSQKIKKPR